MFGQEAQVWTRFLESGDIPIEELWYDVHVGASVKGDWDVDSVPARVALAVTRKRIDVVAVVDGVLWIIEVKPVAMHFAIGQVLAYETLFANEYEHDVETWPVIVCDTCDPDVIPLCQSLGVVVVANL